jgi:hypothetical protein
VIDVAQDQEGGEAVTYGYCIATVGLVTEVVGPGPTRWHMLMLPFGIFGRSLRGFFSVDAAGARADLPRSH